MERLYSLMEKKGNYKQSGKSNNNYRNGSGMYAKTVKKRCERCGTNKSSKMQVHHKDGDRSNNAPSNLQTLCQSCHERQKARARGLKNSSKPPKKK